MAEDVKVTGSEVLAETGADENRVYTRAEVDELLQKETDRRVTDALKKQERKNQEKMREAQKLAQMSEQDKYVYELEQREKAIAEKEKALALAENKTEASKILADKGIDLSLVDFVVAETAEEMNQKINLLDKAFKKSVKAEVERRIGGKAPKQGNPVDKTLTKDDFMKMSFTELLELKRENPELYQALSN